MDIAAATRRPADAGAPRLVHLDGLRGVAAVGVVLYHVYKVYGLKLGFERGYLFVDLFFMLSGFVLTRAWAGAFSRGVGSATLMRARLRRLWPTVAAGAVLGAGVHWVVGDVAHVWPLLVLALALLPHLGHRGPIFPLNGPQWSIFWELIANFLHIFCGRHLGERSLLLFAGVMGSCMILAIVICGQINFGPMNELWWFGAARVGWSYAVGMVIARRWQPGQRWDGARWWLVLGLIVLAVLLLPWLPLSLARGDMLVVLVVFPALFWAMVRARPPRASARVLAWLGGLSFPLYATHLTVLFYCAAQPWPKAPSAALAVGAALLLAAGAALASGRQQRRRPSAATCLTPGALA